jgi:hypothetical protein
LPDQTISNLAVELRDLVDYELIHSIVTQVSLLLRSQFEYLAGHPHPLNNLLVGKPCLPHRDHLIHGYETIPV